MTRVLVVHADPRLAASMGTALEGSGLETRLVHSGEAAMDHFIQDPADVVVLDYALSGRDGVATAEAIRWMPGGRRARIILTSAVQPDDGTLTELGARVDAFAALVGPLDVGRVRAMVEAAALVRGTEGETRVLSPELVRAVRSFDDRTAPTRELELPGDLIGALTEPEPATVDQPMPPVEGAADPSLGDADGTREGHEVRAAAVAAKTTHSDVFGTFERMGFAEVLHRLAERRATGALVCSHPIDGRPTVNSERPTKVVYCRAGVPVNVRSNLVVECLGHVLSQQRAIGPEALRRSLEAMRRGEGRQGELLVSMGAIEPAELSEALATQMRIKLLELFGWNAGTFRFSTELAPPPELIDLEMGLAEIVLAGTRLSLGPEDAVAKLSAVRSQYPIARARALVRFVQLELEPDLRELVHRADGSRTVGTLLDDANDPGAGAQLLVAMLALEAIRLSPAPTRTRPTPASLPSAADIAPAAPDPPVEPAPDPAPVEPAPDPAPVEPAPDPAPVEPTGTDAPSDRVELRSAARESLPETVERPLSDADLRPSTVPPPARLRRGVPPASDAPEEGSALTARPRASAPPPATDPEEKRRHQQGLDDRVQRLLRAERHARRAQRALDRGRPEEAIAAIERALALCPEEGEFVALSAWAQHRRAPDDTGTLERALDRSAEACELAPRRMSVQLIRARLLRAAGRIDEARDAFRRVLAVAPEHDEALEALRATR